jgi:transposase
MIKTKQPSTREWNPTQKVQHRTDFTNRILYVGIDVHKVRWQVAVYYEGLILSNTSIDGSSDSLITHLRKRYRDAQFSCMYESSPFGFTLCRSLWAAGKDWFLLPQWRGCHRFCRS